MLSPVGPLWLVFVPFALLLLAFRSNDWVSVAVAAIVLGLCFAGSRPDGMEWYVPRAWSLIVGGTFVAATVLHEPTVIAHQDPIRARRRRQAVCDGDRRPAL